MKYIYFLALSVVFLSTTQSAYAQPAIEVWYGATQITDNQPSTVLLGTGYQGTNLDNTMQIRNTGTADLIIFSISVSGFNFSYVGATPPFTISAGGSRDFTVRFYNPGKAANTGAVLIETSIIGDNTFAFQTFARLTGPEVDVTRGTSTLPNSIQSVSVGETHNYGNVIQGASGSQAFSIHNTSPNNTLTISNVNVSGDFTLSSQVGTNTIATNSKTTFSVTFNTNMLGSKSGSVSFTTNDADEPNYTFPLAANVILPAPTTQATDLTFSNVTTTSMTVDWSNGNGVNRIVVAKEGSAVDAAPDDNTSYNADPDFGVGAEIGSGNFVVYNGNGSSVDITNLNPKIFYHFQVFEYNGSTGTEAYNTSVVSGSTDRRWAGQSFVTRWNTSRPGTSGTNRITIPTVGGGYNYDVDWEEVGTPANNGKFRGVSGDAIITFPSGGNYEVEISGNFPRVRFDNATDARRLSRIMQWGDIEWSSMEQAFVYCEYLDGTISDSPDLSDVTSTFMMFQFAAFFDEDVSSWNMSNINNMEGMFAQAVSFNNGGQPLDWGNSTAAVTNMEGLFTDASAFNQDVSDWNVSNVTNMSAMFWGASSFNRDISSWDVRSVTDMSNMLTGTTAFRNGSQPLDWLNTGMVTNMDAMFSSSGFNQDISGWDVSNVLTMNGMFRGASNFNQSLAAWDISSATNMTNMFDNCNMSMANYESTLLGWADDNGGTETINSNVTLGALNLRYTNNATGRQDLISTNNWNIIGDILLITPPTTQAANLNFTNISTNSMTVNWTNGDGANRIVVVREGNVVDFSPVDGQGYTADPNLTTSTDLGSGNFVVYNGAGSSVGVTGLYENTTYHFQVFEYNGTAGTEKYNLDTNPTNPLSESTIDLYTVINTDNSGVGSLRQAIINANASSGETITFKIPGGGPHVITPTTALPAITSPMTIDGYSQPGASVNTLAVGSDAVLLIEIDGVNINGDGLFINNISNCVIQGLSIHSFDGYGIGINGSLATNNSIRGCYIGVKTDGVTAPFPTTRQRGLQFNGAPNNFIGDGTAAGRNVISGNGNRSPGGGIDVNGSGSTGNQIQGNYIGVDLTGLINVGNYGIGVEIRNGASGNTVGGTNTLSRNIISGNQSEGINFNTGSLNIIIGNYIGVGADGISSIPNQYNGINVANNSTNNQIGGTAPGEANLIANNNGNGIEISSSTSLYNTISGNTIYSNSGNGISLSCGNNNKRFPVITTTTAGTITGTCESGDIIEVFDAGTGDEGQTFLGTALTTGSTWNLSGSFNISSNFTATATSANGSTSEFSRIDGSSPPGLVTPTTQVDGLTLSSFTGTSASLTWANGNGSGRLIVASTSPIIWTPIDGMAYTANSTYGSGVPVDTDTYVVYSGSGSSSSISGLTVSFAYYFKIFEFDVECSANYYNSNTTAGNSMITPPSGQATNLTFTNESTTSMTVNWTNGDGANRIVVAREGNVVDFSPVDGQSYTADPDLTTSTDLGSGNFVVYNDAGSSVGVTGLNENTTYHFQVFEYNGTAGSEIYNVSTATDNPANQITLYREISVFVGAIQITTGDTQSLASTVQPNDASQVFTINNTGTADLIVTAINMTDGSKYAVSGITFPNTIAAGLSTDFTLILDGNAAGTFTDQLTIVNNDGNFVINLSGIITATPVPAIEVTDGSTTLVANDNYTLTSTV
ncbi:MAG TPA: BspA family leucine-rich repeat surface protein, partial [Fulvivirga sp.]|nr:BspA family leucine-rich repeat surface protein [Fulvivirga sp.]